jgi:hypothetical protein
VTGGKPPGAPPPEDGRITGGRRVALGCLTAFLGAISGMMVAVLLSVFVAFLTRAPRCPDIPSCNWYVYAGYGAIVGGLSLPAVVLWTISRPRKTN